jgi:hypothetical protein
MWEFYEKNGFWVVRNVNTDVEFLVTTRMCAITLSATLNEYEININNLRGRLQ